jgi:hypothetical protein
MIGLVRFHTFRQGVFRLIEVNHDNAESTRNQLLSDGYVFWSSQEMPAEKVVEHVQMV